MTVTTLPQLLTFEEYLNYCDGTDTSYELVKGKLVPMSLGTGLHGEIIDFLYHQFSQAIRHLEQDWVVRALSIGIQSPRGYRWDTSRIPDLMIIPAAQWRELRNREAVIKLNEPPPLLVLEVVSESTQNTDYRSKRVEYNLLGIPEYWIVDPLESKITIFSLREDLYEGSEFRGVTPLSSVIFPNLEIIPQQVLNPDV